MPPGRMIVGCHLEQTGHSKRRQASVRDPPEGFGEARHRQHHQPVALVRVSAFVLNNGGQLRPVQKSHRARTDDDAWTDARKAVGDGGRVIDRERPRPHEGRRGQQVEQSAVARSGQDRAHNDDPHHTHEHHADVSRQRQTEGVGETEALQWMTAGDPLSQLSTPPTKPA